MINAAQMVSALLLTAACTGCISLKQTPDQVAVRPPGERMIGALRPFLPEAKRHLEYAWLSQAAYEKTDAADNNPDSCQDADQALDEAEWRPWEGFPTDPALKAELLAYHLRVEVWSKQNPLQVAVAFGGTVFDNGNDWRANLRWFIPRHEDQYTLVVRKVGHAFVEEFKRRAAQGQWPAGLPTLVTTGHSLGGGLAQQFAYALPEDATVPRVSDVYAFHPSPVTGYFSVPESLREGNAKGLRIERIYERGEVLALLRAIQSVFFRPSDVNPEISGYRYSMVHKAGPIKDHSLGKFACSMAEKLGGKQIEK